MHPKKLENLLELSPDERYGYFVRKFGDSRVAYGLTVKGKGWVLFVENEGGREIFPIWPHEEVAREAMREEHRTMGAIPTEISLEGFEKHCVPDQTERGALFGVFYSLDSFGILIEPKDLLHDVMFEYRELYG